MVIKSNICCQDLQGLYEQKSSFLKVISFGYYDGPTSGIAQCAKCSAAYKYDMLDWDEGQDVRIFSFAPLPSGIFSEIVKVCTKLEKPRWPLWVPRWDFPSTSLKTDVESRISRLFDSARRPTFVLASKDITKKILASKKLEEIDQEFVQDYFSSGEKKDVRDWFAFLELRKTKQKKR